MTQSLLALLEHAERERDDARAELAKAEEQQRALQLQAEQLHDYRNDYDGRHPARHGRSAPIELLRCHLGFMQRLQQAQALQQGQLQAAEARTAQRRETLLALEVRAAAVRKLLERRQTEHQRLRDRQEQRSADEAATQRHRRLQANAQADLR